MYSELKSITTAARRKGEGKGTIIQKATRGRDTLAKRYRRGTIVRSGTEKKEGDESKRYLPVLLVKYAYLFA